MLKVEIYELLFCLQLWETNFYFPTINISARLVLFGGANLDEDEVELQTQSPALRSRPPPFPSPSSRPRPRSVAPEFHRRSANLDYRELKIYEPRPTFSRGPSHERSNYSDYQHLRTFDPGPTYQRFGRREVRSHTQERCSKLRLCSSVFSFPDLRFFLHPTQIFCL